MPRPLDAGATIHDAHGWWIAEAGSPEVAARARRRPAADVVIVGGGYTGMWAAWHVLAADPEARVVLLEAGRCGHGPSGRNGGFVSGMALSRPSLTARFGAAAAQAWIDAAADTVRAIGDWCEAEGVDAWYRHGGELARLDRARAGRRRRRRAVDGDEVVALDGAAARARSPRPSCAAPSTCARARTSIPPGSPSGCARGCHPRRAHPRGLPRARAARRAGRRVVETAGGRVRARAASWPQRGEAAPCRRCATA